MGLSWHLSFLPLAGSDTVSVSRLFAAHTHTGYFSLDCVSAHSLDLGYGAASGSATTGSKRN